MITIKTPEEIEIMAEGGRILSGIVREVAKMVKPGVTTKELDKVAEDLIFKFGAEPAFKGYEDFPATLCASVNQVIVHSLPSDYQLKEGDIISLDLGLKHKGYFSDMAITLPVGKINPEKQRLIKVTKKALEKAIKKVKIGNTFNDISYTIQKFIESYGYNVVRELCGHGIGKQLHEDPQILNYAQKGREIKLEQGMVFCLEPMVTAGEWHIKKAKDGFGYETVDGSLSAHFEQTVALTKRGCQVLTR